MSSMTINVMVTNWESMDSARRSLVNFLMKDGAVHLHGVYSGDYNLYQGFSGCVQHKYKAYQYVSYDNADCMNNPICYTLNLPFTDVDQNTYNAREVDKQSRLPLIPSQLVESDSEISFCKYKYHPSQMISNPDPDGEENIMGPDSYVVEKICDLTGGSVIVTPMVGSVPNTNTRLIPSGMYNAPNKTISVNMASSATDILYQLRTSTFKCKAVGADISGSNAMIADSSPNYYYKIGIVPFISDISSKTLQSVGSSDTLSNRMTLITNYLKECKFNFNNGMLMFEDSSNYSMMLCADVSLNGDISAILPDSIIIPISSYNTAYTDNAYGSTTSLEEYYIKGIAYLQLYSEQNPVSNWVHGHQIKISQDGESWNYKSSTDNFIITDEGLDTGEFIPYNYSSSSN